MKMNSMFCVAFTDIETKELSLKSSNLISNNLVFPADGGGIFHIQVLFMSVFLMEKKMMQEVLAFPIFALLVLLFVMTPKLLQEVIKAKNQNSMR